MRFYDANSGTISIDGIPTTAMTKDSLRSQFGMVLQDTWLYHGTIRDNIAYGKPNATDEEVIAAADEYGIAMVVTGVRHFRH
jgi:ATP-binding cassette subfamily B protein